jgi:LPS export ABC transporter protein LptC
MKQLLLLSAMFCLLLAACENNPAEVNALSRKVIEVEEGKNIKAIFSQSGNRKAYLTAPAMMRVKADTQYVEFPKTIFVEFYNEQQQLQNVVKAKYARYFELLGKVFLRDSVVVFNTSGDTLHCKTLWWNQNEENFYTDDTVVINTRTQQLQGTGFWAKSDFSKYTIRNTVGTVLLPGETADSTKSPADSSMSPNSPAPPVAPRKQ